MGAETIKKRPQVELKHLLNPLGHWYAVSQQRSQIVRERVRVACLVLCAFMLAMAAGDMMILPDPASWQVAGMRAIAGFTFMGVAWAMTKPGSALSTGMALALMHFVLPALHLSVQPILATSTAHSADILMRLSSQLPVVTVAWMSLFPLTVLETVGLAAPLLAFVLIGLAKLTGTTNADVVAAVGPLSLLVAVSAVSGASQLAHLISLVIRTTHDGLTDCLNRKAGEEIVELQIRMAERTKSPACLLFIDIDNFKSVNDGYGHEAGDDVLRGLSEALRERLRTTDKAIRWGGEEFVVLLPATVHEGLRTVVGRLQGHLGARPDGNPITASIGAAFTDEAEAGTTVDSIVALADSRMYQAKKSGKNRCIGPDGVVEPA